MTAKLFFSAMTLLDRFIIVQRRAA